jgi:hypothetical protein
MRKYYNRALFSFLFPFLTSLEWMLGIYYNYKLGFIGEEVTETLVTGARGVSIPPEPPEKAPAISREPKLSKFRHFSRRAIWREPLWGVWGE